MDYQIREIRENEYPILSDFLYEAIFIPEGMEKPPKSIFGKTAAQWRNEKGISGKTPRGCKNSCVFGK